jgi:CubicO group peptidase (beta-lactamase class C family)
MDREQALKTILNQKLLFKPGDQEQKLLFKPGDQEAYSNSGYTLLAAIIELSSKQSNKSFLEEYLFKQVIPTNEII